MFAGLREANRLTLLTRLVAQQSVIRPSDAMRWNTCRYCLAPALAIPAASHSLGRCARRPSRQPRLTRAASLRLSLSLSALALLKAERTHLFVSFLWTFHPDSLYGQ